MNGSNTICDAIANEKKIVIIIQSMDDKVDYVFKLKIRKYDYNYHISAI